MKYRVGGTLSFKAMPKAYEPVEAISVFEIEIEGDLSEEEIDKLQGKANRRLEEDLNKKAAVALKAYRDFKRNIGSV